MTTILLILFIAPTLTFALWLRARHAFDLALRRMVKALPCWLDYSDC